MTSRRNKTRDLTFFVIIWLVVSAVTLVLFYRQTIGNPDSYASDMKAYILEMQGLDSGYSFPYPIFFKLGALIHLFVGPELAIAIATMLLNSMAMAVVKLALNRLMLKTLEEAYGGWAGVLISLATFSLFFMSMLFPPEGIYLRGINFTYVGVFSGNPFHNATYMAARPFAVLAFLWYVKLLDIYEKGVPKGAAWRDYGLFALFLLLTTMTKPSFTIVLAGTAGLIMLYRLIKSRFHNFMPTLMLGLCFVPTFIDLLYQYQGVFVPEEGVEGGIGFGFGDVWSLYCDNILLGVCLAMGCPLLVLALHLRQLKTDTLYRFSWQVYGMSFLMAFFLYEKGFRKVDFNFSWGYMYGIFFGMLGTLIVLLGDTARKGKKWRLFVQWGAWLWHVACGVYYFVGIYCGGSYY
ncbi:MAG: hypothetical protein NC417_00895 [Candidatus Gastranaerophilales bacterium]|nr:hypothetical protein [Candidatus Gastranaerophilales bacterium]